MNFKGFPLRYTKTRRPVFPQLLNAISIFQMIKSIIVSDPGDEVSPIVETDTKKLIRVAIVGAGGSGSRVKLPFFGVVDVPKGRPNLRAISLVEKTEDAYCLKSEFIPIESRPENYFEQALEARREKVAEALYWAKAAGRNGRVFDAVIRDKAEEAISILGLGCPHSCGPSDFCKGGKCEQMGCRKPDEGETNNSLKTK